MITNIDSNIQCNFSLMAMLILCANLSCAGASLTLAQCQLIITLFMVSCVITMEYKHFFVYKYYFHLYIPVLIFYVHYRPIRNIGSRN